MLTPSGKTYNASAVKAFDCDSDGAVLSGVLVADKAGNVCGTTNSGCGANGNPDGTIFELAKQGGSWTFQTMVQMPASIAMSGAFGTGYQDMAFDNQGNLYGLVYPTCSQADAPCRNWSAQTFSLREDFCAKTPFEACSLPPGHWHSRARMRWKALQISTSPLEHENSPHAPGCPDIREIR